MEIILTVGYNGFVRYLTSKSDGNCLIFDITFNQELRSPWNGKLIWITQCLVECSKRRKDRFANLEDIRPESSLSPWNWRSWPIFSRSLTYLPQGMHISVRLPQTSCTAWIKHKITCVKWSSQFSTINITCRDILRRAGSTLQGGMAHILTAKNVPRLEKEPKLQSHIWDNCKSQSDYPEPANPGRTFEERKQQKGEKTTQYNWSVTLSSYVQNGMVIEWPT